MAPTSLLDTPLAVLSPEFRPYGPSHWTILAVFVLLAATLIVCGRRTGHRRGTVWFRRGFAILIVGLQLPLQIYSMLPPHWDLTKSLPFQLCDLAWMAAAHALWTRHRFSVGLLYYWGLTLTSQALITPQLERDFPHLEFVMFWSSHILVVLAAIYLTWGLSSQPGWREYCSTSLVTIGWTLVMLVFNATANTNYLYVNHKPDNGTILDLFGDWPTYLGVEIVVALLLWAAMTWPWTRRNSLKEKLNQPESGD